MKRKQLLLLLALLITAATGAWAQTGMTKGLFSVSATKRVHFSKGNLQYDGTNWKFAASQWEVLGANGTGANGTATNYPMDLFTWGNIDSPTYDGTTYYTENADLSGIADWGSRMGSGWYTLSKDEWLYLFGMEENNTDKSGHARYRKYFRATVNGVSGIVVLPDDLSGISDIPAESSRGTASTFSGKTYTTDAWSAMESAGCVFLPTAGFRNGASVSHVGLNGFYWPSTANGSGSAFTVGFDKDNVFPANNFNRNLGFAVRLVIDGYVLTLADNTKDAGKWTATVGTSNTANPLPVGGLSEKDAVTLTYGGRLKVKNVTATTDAKPVWDGDLSKLTAESTAEFATATDGMTIKGTLAANVKVSIAAGATVTLDGVTINGVSNEDYKWAGLNCLGNATIVLKDGTTNTVTGFSEVYPGIHVPKDKTLTIQGGTEGNGKLTASSNGFGAGIGGGYSIACGDISIEGGIITAGGQTAAGIGSGFGAICGNITISGGTVTATGGYKAAGIGGGPEGTCGAITIANTVTKVTATKDQDAPYSIGAGGYSGGNLATCGTVTIGGTKYWENNAAVDNDANTYLAQATIEFVNLAKLTADYEAKNGTTLYGQLAGNYKISIAAGATVTLKDVNINGGDNYSYKWAGITCLGDATIILADNSENTVKGFYNEYPGIYVPSGKKLTIQGGSDGNGKLTASSNGYAAGIGGGYNIACGNITISGGTVEATGGDLAAGIGGGNSASCGNITINGGTITATGGKHGPGIGGGNNNGACGTITITSGVTSVTATKGTDAPNSIGSGYNGTAITVSIEAGANVTQK